MSVKKDIIVRLYIAFFAVALVGVLIVLQTFRIQQFKGEFYRSMADSLTLKHRPIEATRGNVLSDDGRLLATSLPYFDVRVDWKSEALTDRIFNDNIDSLAYFIAKFKKDKSRIVWKNELKRQRKKGNRYYLLARNVTYPELQEIKSWPIFRLGKYRGGLIVIRKNKRETPFKVLAHRTIGYVRSESQSVGLEAAFDEYLSGTEGVQLMQRIAGGTLIPVNDEDVISPENGKDVVTTIDVNLQDVAESALENAVRKFGADHGCAVVMEVATGKIRAIANIGKTEDGTYWEDYNYAVGEATEPGSTMKLAALLALLEDKHLDIYDYVDLEKGVKQYYKAKMKDSDEHDLRDVTVKHAFEISSNVGISKLVDQYYRDDPARYVHHLRAIGLDKKTGIEIRGERNPRIKDPAEKSWSGITLPWMSVGYELTLTPLQTLTFYNAIANNGKSMQPYLVQEIQEYGKTVKTFKPKVLNESVCSPETLEKLKLLLEGVVSEKHGTAHHLRSRHYNFAGKTGTARIANKKYGYAYKKVYQASFAGYFPAENPKYSCIVVVNAPTNGVYYGGWVAGPVFRAIADYVYASSIEMHDRVNKNPRYIAGKLPEVKSGYKQDAEKIYNTIGVSCYEDSTYEWVAATVNDNSIKLSECTVKDGIIPDVRGMGLRDALYLLENRGLKVSFEGKGKVLTQSIRYGTRATKGREIKLVLG